MKLTKTKGFILFILFVIIIGLLDVELKYVAYLIFSLVFTLLLSFIVTIVLTEFRLTELDKLLPK